MRGLASGKILIKTIFAVVAQLRLDYCEHPQGGKCKQKSKMSKQYLQS